MKKRYLLIILLIIFLSVLNNSSCLARELEVDYPSLPGAPDVTFLPQYIQYLFTLGVVLAGVLSLLAMVIGGVKYILSVGAPEKRNDAKNQIFSGLFGLIILLSSYLVLTNINPELEELRTPALKGVPGVKLVSDEDKKDCPVFVENTEAKGFKNYHTVEYICTLKEKREGSIIRIFSYPHPGFHLEEGETASKIDLECGDKIPKPGKSFIYIKLKPGIYLYRERGCVPTFPPPSVQTGPIAGLGENYNNKIKSIEIIHNDHASAKNRGYFIVYLIDKPSFRGGCVLLNTTSSGCYEVNIAASSIYVFLKEEPIFLLPPEEIPEVSAGEGINLYSRPYKNGGYYSIEDENIHPNISKRTDEIEFYYHRGAHTPFSSPAPLAPQKEQEKYKTFYDSPGSIMINGDYLVILWNGTNFENGTQCQIFEKNIPNLKWEWISQENRWPILIQVWPTKLNY